MPGPVVGTENLRGQVVSALRWNAASKLLSQLLTWLATIAIIRLLQPADYGLMAMATWFNGLLGLMSELGMGSAIIVAERLDRRRLRQAFGVVLVTNGTCMLAGLLLAPLAASFFREPRLTLVIQALSLQFLLVALAVLPQALLERDLRFRRRSTVDVVCNSLAAGGTLLLAWRGYGVWALVGGNLMLLGLRVVGLHAIRPALIRPSFSLAGFRGDAVFGGYVTLSRAVWYFYSQADVFLAGRLLGNQALGAYAVARQLAWLPMEKLSPMLTQVAYPAFARGQADRGRSARHLLLAVRSASFVLFPLCFGLSAVAPELVSIVLGDRWAEAIVALQVLSLAIPVRTISNITNSAVQGIGRADTLLLNAVWSSALMIPALIVGCHFGVTGLSVVWAVVFPLVFLFRLPRSLVEFGVSTGKFLGNMAWPAAASTTMYIVLLVLRHVTTRNVPEVVMLVGLSVVGALFYAALAWGLGRDRCYEVLALVRG